jgi:hypothetical protein
MTHNPQIDALVFGFTLRVLKCSIDSGKLLAGKLILNAVFENSQSLSYERLSLWA